RGLRLGRRGLLLTLRLLDALEVETGRRLAGIDFLGPQKERLRPLVVAGLEALPPPLQVVRDEAALIGHLLPRSFDPRDGVGVVDVYQENAGPDLDRLLPLAFPGRLVALLQQGVDVAFRGARLFDLGVGRRAG